MRRNKIKLWQIITASLLCLALVGAVACPAPGGEGAADVDLVEVVRGDLNVIVSGSGNITVSQDASLAFGTGGKVEAVYVEAGDEVRAGYRRFGVVFSPGRAGPVDGGVQSG